jgi:hypothetical protein
MAENKLLASLLTRKPIRQRVSYWHDIIPSFHCKITTRAHAARTRSPPTNASPAEIHHERLERSFKV